MPAKKSEKPAAEKPPAKEVKLPASKVEKPIEKPVPQPAKPVGLPKPAAQPPAMLAKDLGAEKFLVAILKELKDKASQEDISKIVNTEWAKINTWKIQTAKAYIKGKFSSSVDPKDAIIVGHGDAVKEKTVIGATVYLVKGKAFVNLRLVGKSVLDYEHLTAGRMVSKMNTANYEITPETAESAPITDVDFYNAILTASIPKADVPTHKFAGYEIIAMECKVRSFGADFTNPKATKNDSLMFSFSPLAITEWDITGWIQTRQFGGSYLSFLGQGELAEYSRMTWADKATFIDSILRDQIVMVVLKLGKEPFKSYQSDKGEFTNLDGEIITLMLRPDELDPVVYESRPIRVAKPASSVVDSVIISGQSNTLTVDEVIRQTGLSLADITSKIQAKQADMKGLIKDEAAYIVVLKELGIDVQGREIEYPTNEQPVGGTPVQLPAEVLAKIAEIKLITGKDDALIQQDAIDVMEANAQGSNGNVTVTMLEALNALLQQAQEKIAPPKGSLAPPAKEVDYTNPEDDTPALKRIRQVAIKSKTWEFSYKDIMDWAKTYNVKDVTEQTVPKEIFEQFIAANKAAK